MSPVLASFMRVRKEHGENVAMPMNGVIRIAVQGRYKLLWSLCVSISSLQGIAVRCLENRLALFHGTKAGSNPAGDAMFSVVCWRSL